MNRMPDIGEMAEQYFCQPIEYMCLTRFSLIWRSTLGVTSRVQDNGRVDPAIDILKNASGNTKSVCQNVLKHNIFKCSTVQSLTKRSILCSLPRVSSGSLSRCKRQSSNCAASRLVYRKRNEDTFIYMCGRPAFVRKVAALHILTL